MASPIASEKANLKKAHALKCKKYLCDLFDFNVKLLVGSVVAYIVIRLLYSNVSTTLILNIVAFPFIYSVFMIYEIFTIFLAHWLSSFKLKYPEATSLLSPEEIKPFPNCKNLALKIQKSQPIKKDELPTLQLRTLQTFKTPLEKIDLLLVCSNPEVKETLQLNGSGAARMEKVLSKVSPKSAVNDFPSLNDIGPYSNTKPTYPHSIMAALKGIESFEYLFPSETEKELSIKFDYLFEANARHWIYTNIIHFLVKEIAEVDKYLTEKKLFHLLCGSPSRRFLGHPKQQQPTVTGFGNTLSATTAAPASKQNMPLDLLDLYKDAPDLASQKMAVRRLAIERYLNIVPYSADRSILCLHLKNLSNSPLLISVKGDYGCSEVELDDTLESPLTPETAKLIPGLELTDTQLLLHLIVTFFNLNYSPNAPPPRLDGNLFDEQFFAPYGQPVSGIQLF
ncbi:hypothetical protein DSO57_1037829 [Entomophthora muscae]|uniref:Uncharacterized protein n=1 Tax=Entomophthora muscae TaxID=34485 RepID=A0ACC2TL98_9FUNG|nr:hypothetical protein DSO57_1037829 [Entomophthora muscae]